MVARNADGPLSVEIPSAGADRPSWGKVGIFTAIGFLIGVGWPRVAGVRVGPSLPSDAVVASAAGPSLALPVPNPASAPAVASAAPPSAPPAVASAPAPATSAAPVSLTVAHGAVVSCRSSSGDLLKGADCGTLPGLDGLVMPALRKVSECPQAAGATGKLHLMVRVDFGRGTVLAEAGKGTTVADPDPLVACAKTAVADLHPTGIAHDNQRYGVSYHLTFAGDDRSAASATPPASGAVVPQGATDGEAQVAWDVAIVRDAPRTGKILAKLDRGASVRIGSPSQGWYPVKYGDGFSSEGWVYRAAIGK
jgi:hypothetical protein